MVSGVLRRERAGGWRFARMTQAQMNENPVQGEFFSSAAALPERLVRESIQNSLDAAQPGAQVRVRFAFSGEQHELPPDRANRYWRELGTHMDAVADQVEAESGGAVSRKEVREEEAVYEAAALLTDPLHYLVVEDFGTSGLTGDIRANGAREEGNNFWGFFRQIGIGTKGDDAAGSWGLGKWVFPDASQINAFLAFTRRPHERETYLMGLAILKTHNLGAAKYPAYGHFAAEDPASDAAWLPMPLSSADAPGFLAEAQADFGLRRSERSGLSVVIPWPQAELTPQSIARAAITQYFLPIVRGDLVVEIDHPEDFRVIDERRLEEEIRRMPPSDSDDESPESMLSLIKLTRWALRQEPQQHIRLPLPTQQLHPLKEPDKLPAWERRQAAAVDLAELQERFNSNEPLAFRLMVDVPRTVQGSARTDDPLYVYVERDDALAQGHDYFVRGPLRVPKMDHLKSLKARALLIAESGTQLGHLLRDAEGPAHTEWKGNRDRVREKWVRAGKRIDEVRRAPYRLVQALVERPLERQLDALADLFPADIKLRTAAAAKPRGGRSPREVPETPSFPQPLALRQQDGGFRVEANPSFPLEVIGTNWRVRFAYAVARGKKAKAFAQFARGVQDGCPDFSLNSDLSLNQHGCQLLHMTDNELTIRIQEESFQLRVAGFDPLRDVIVEVDPLQEPALTAGAGGGA